MCFRSQLYSLGKIVRHVNHINSWQVLTRTRQQTYYYIAFMDILKNKLIFYENYYKSGSVLVFLQIS